MVVHHDYPEDVRVAREVRVALKEGYDVDVVALRARRQPARDVVDGVRVFRFPPEHKRGKGLVSSALEYVGFTALAFLCVTALSLRRPYTVIHVHNPPDFLVLAALVPKMRGARLVFDVHDLSSDMFDMRFEGRPGGEAVGHLLRLIEKLATRWADAVLTVHEPYRRELVARGIAPSKITVVMNSLDETRVSALGRPSPPHGFRIVYHGAVTPHYGVEALVDATALVACKIPDAFLDIYGDGDSIPAIRARAVALGIADRVRISPRIPHTDVLAQVRSAAVGVIPNLATKLNRFALSSKLFEYVVLGVPVVSSDLPTIREHFSDDELLFFRPGDSNALADALLTVARDRAGATARASAALRRYDEYRWSRNARRYAAVLNGLAPKSRAWRRSARQVRQMQAAHACLPARRARRA